MKTELTFFKHCILNETGVLLLRDHLIKENLIDDKSTEEDFIYFFCGKGNCPSMKIVWKSTVTLLSIYIFSIKDADFRPEWTVAENVFEGVSAASLRDMHSKPFSKDSSRSFDSFFEAQRVVTQTIENIRKAL